MEGTGLPPFPIGEKVLYWSRSTAQWLPATVLGHNLSHVASKTDSPQAKLWSYQLDVQPQAPPSLVLRRTDEKSALKTPAGYPRPRLVVPNTCPWPMARSPTPCAACAQAGAACKLAPSAAGGVSATPPSATTLPLAAVVAPETLHVTTRLPRHSLTSTEPHTLIGTTELDALLTPTRSLGSLGTPTHSPSAQVRHCTPEPRETRRSSPVAQLMGPLASPTQRTRSPQRQVLIPGAVTVVAPPALPRAPQATAASATPVPPLPLTPLTQAAETVPVPASVAPTEPVKVEKTPGSGPVIITVPSTKMLRPVGSRATVPMPGYCTPKEPMSPPRSMPRARIQVMPPATPPRQKHRVVMPLGAAQPQPRPHSLLRAAVSARSVEMLSPKDPQTPHLPMSQSQSLLVPSTRCTSPGRSGSPVRQMVATLSQRTLHTVQPAVTPMTAPRSPLGIESRHLQSRSARPQLHQWGVPPEKWGIHFDQLLELEQHQKFQRDWNTREVVSEIIWPETAGKGIGYALWQNFSQPLSVAVMVSHAWDESFVDLLLALSVAPQAGPLWVAATALYQSEESLIQILARPLDLVNQVLRGRSLLCVLSSVDVYERLWCLFEMSCAVELGVEVNTSRKPKGRGAWALDEAFLTACGKPVDSASAKCGAIGPCRDAERYEQALRRAIEQMPKSYEGINRAVEMARLTSLNKYREQLCGGGWSTTGIGKQYSDVIGEICMRIGIHQPQTSPTPSLPMRPKNSILSPFPQNGLATKRDLTPRTGHRQHWGKITSL